MVYLVRDKEGEERPSKRTETSVNTWKKRVQDLIG